MNEDDADEELMRKACDGDETAFNALYNRYNKKLYNYLKQKIFRFELHGGGDGLNDLFQDIWINLMKACEHYRETIPFQPYLYKMASNRVVDEYRKKRTRNRLIDDNHKPRNSLNTNSNEDSHNPHHFHDPQSKSPDQIAETEETLEEIARRILNDLPIEQQEAFILFVNGHSIREIADITGVSMETAKSRVRYAVKKLRPKLDRLQRGL